MLSSGRMWPVAELHLVVTELAHKDFINFNVLLTLCNWKISHNHLNFWLLLKKSEKLLTKDPWFSMANTGWSWATWVTFLRKHMTQFFPLSSAVCHPGNSTRLVPTEIYMHVPGKGAFLALLEACFPVPYFFPTYIICQMLTCNYTWKCDFQTANSKFQDLL